jgi:HAD superfamily hydrolase (TIGR01490 family)
MKLALFDLDHTLIPFDSGMAWTRFLAGKGVLPADAEARYLDYCRQYVAGTLDIHAMHRASVTPLARFARATLDDWCREFELQMAPRVSPAMRRCVQEHQRAGDLCAVVTATTRFIAEPLARAFGIEHVLATEAAVRDGTLTGEIDGVPCYREHKLTHLHRWLERRGANLAEFEQSWFYSDSASDLPLLMAVSHPVAVRPDEHLAAHARAAGWSVIHGLE